MKTNLLLVLAFLAAVGLHAQTLIYPKMVIPTMGQGAGGSPTGAAGGDLSGTFPNPIVSGINGTMLSSLGTGLLANTTGTGVPYISKPFGYSAVIDGGVPTDGVTDAQPSLKSFFATVGALATATNPLTITIPPGKYYIGLTSSSNVPIIPSNVTVIATGANFIFPTTLSGLSGGNTQYPMMDAFSGVDVNNFTWIGGTFNGNAFNQYLSNYTNNTWLPQEGVLPIDLTSTSGNGCVNCEIREITSNNMAGINISGINSVSWGHATDNYLNVTTWCKQIRMIDDHFNNCGLPLWDYGWLWQIISFQSQYTANQIAMAYAYINQTTLYGTVGMTNGDTHVTFANTSGAPAGVIPIAPDNTNLYWVSFYFDAGSGGNLPSNIASGTRYFVVGSSSTGIQIATTFGGTPITFASSGTNVKMIYNLYNAYYNMYLPVGAVFTAARGPIGDGAFDIQNAQNVIVDNCTWSSYGDSSQFMACQDLNVTNCQDSDSQMGMLFCSGGNRCNFVNDSFVSTHGSRTITVEQGGNSTVVNTCTFIGGRRGTSLDGFRDLTIDNCLLLNNNYADVSDYSIGRIDPTTGTWGLYGAISTGSVSQSWGGIFNITRNKIYTNSTNGIDAITTFGTVASGSLVYVDGNIGTGNDPRISNSGSAWPNSYIGFGTTAGGRQQGQYTATVSSASTINIPHTLGNSVQDTNGVVIWATATPANSTSPIPSYITTSTSNVTLNFTTPVTGTVLYNWEVRYLPN